MSSYGSSTSKPAASVAQRASGARRATSSAPKSSATAPKRTARAEASAAPTATATSSKPLTPKQFAAAVKTVERSMRRDTVERATVWNNAGQVVLEKGGRVVNHKGNAAAHAKYSQVVEFSTADLAHLKGATLTHPHPGGESFSDLDMKFAATQQLAEMRAVTRDARYSVRPSANGWTAATWKQSIGPAYRRAERAVIQEQAQAIHRGQLTQADADRQYLHTVWQRVAQETGVQYTREPWTAPRRTRATRGTP